jgi:hypothetical protein
MASWDEVTVSWLAHQFVGGDEVDEFAESVAFRLPIGLETTEGGLVGEAEWTAERIGEELMREVLGHQVRVIDEVGADIRGALDGLTAVFAGGVYEGAVRVGPAEVADGIVAFEGVAERVDLGVTVRAGLDRAVFLLLRNCYC